MGKTISFGGYVGDQLAEKLECYEYGEAIPFPQEDPCVLYLRIATMPPWGPFYEAHPLPIIAVPRKAIYAAGRVEHATIKFSDPIDSVKYRFREVWILGREGPLYVDWEAHGEDVMAALREWGSKA